MTALDLHTMDTDSLAQRCAEETARFFRRTESVQDYCFELFRRAIAGRSQYAWQKIYGQYQPSVLNWVKSHPSFSRTGEEPEFYCNGAFARMWASFTPEKFTQTQELAGILKFLKMCVHSAIMDSLRRERAETSSIDELEGGSSEPRIDPAIDERIDRLHLWDYIKSLLKDEQEIIVTYGCFVNRLKPQEVLDAYPHHFSDISEVYNVKRNVMNRLRRNAEIEKYVQS
ncbi:MAG: sigma-70 family RNA polymerase sigma factor [Chloroflexi bacterium]|nr:sigma-70 family RNA polymerase sigma factor [Chloroflexota bacterium]